MVQTIEILLHALHQWVYDYYLDDADNGVVEESQVPESSEAVLVWVGELS